jgi:phosphoglucosamine mutase
VARLFGTDGIRGVANVDLTAPLAYALGRATASQLLPNGGAIVIGQDTRRSGDMLAAGLVAGAASLGVDVHRAGVLPTPALAHVTPQAGFGAAVMVSASHNPARDNGLKVLDAYGSKLGDDAEARLEELMGRADALGTPGNDSLGREVQAHGLVDRYREHRRGIARAVRTDLPVLLDCANGAGGIVAPEILHETGAALAVLFDAPDGSNINLGCGATAPEALADAVRRSGAAIGFALDGDADRCVAVDERGEVVDGDQLIGLIALDRLARGALGNGTLVVTILSNGGLVTAVEAAGGRVERTPVGDRHISEQMKRSTAVLGGEKSGHVIVAEHASAGDGIVTALEVLGIVARSGRPLSELKAAIPLFPQQQRAVTVRHKDAWAADEALSGAVTEAERQLSGSGGRVLVRPSGTESVLRIMVEGPDAGQVSTLADDLAALAAKRLD